MNVAAHKSALRDRDSRRAQVADDACAGLEHHGFVCDEIAFHGAAHNNVLRGNRGAHQTCVLDGDFAAYRDFAFDVAVDLEITGAMNATANERSGSDNASVCHVTRPCRRCP